MADTDVIDNTAGWVSCSAWHHHRSPSSPISTL